MIFINKPLIVLTGPTAVGKTKLSISLAKKINGEIISADSMQVYKGMDIGTAKIKTSQMQGIKHYLINILNPDEEFNVVIFKEYAQKAIDEIYKKGKIPIVVGGTGFYIQALLYDIDFKETHSDNQYRNKLQAIANEKGNEYLHSLLKEIDPLGAKSIHPNNVKRVIRALEYYKETNGKISEHNLEQRQNKSPYDFRYFVLNDNREIIYERINKRIDVMLEEGLIEEVKGLINKGYTKDMVSMQGIGYKEIFDYFEGNQTIEDTKYILKRDTRHFAKRQLTWFNREKEVIWINKNEFKNNTEILNKIMEYI